MEYGTGLVRDWYGTGTGLERDGYGTGTGTGTGMVRVLKLRNYIKNM